MAHRNFSRTVRGPRRQTEWLGSAIQGYTAIAAGAKQLNSSFAFIATPEAPVTITRTVGSIKFGLASNAGDADLIGAMGICVVSDLALAAGAASIPGPITDAAWDGWLMHVFFSFQLEFNDSTGVFIKSQRVDFDSRGMRKVPDPAYSLAIMVENGGSTSIEVLPQFRMLVKLH